MCVRHYSISDQMGQFINLVVVLSLSLSFCLLPDTASAQLRQNFYANTCPNVENIVRAAVAKKFNQTFVTVPATIRLFFHDCFVQVWHKLKNTLLSTLVKFVNLSCWSELSFPNLCVSLLSLTGL